MRNDSDRLQWQTEKNYIMNTFHNGLRRIQTDSKTAQQYVLLCLALAVAALIMVSGGSGEDVISVVFRPFVNFIRVIAWLAECLGVIYLFGYIPHSWSYYDDFSRAGICNQAHEAPLLVKANRDGNIQQLTFSLKGCPLEYWEDNRTTIESALNVTVLSITQGSNNQLFDLRVVAGCNLMGRLIPWADTYMDDSDTKIVLTKESTMKNPPLQQGHDGPRAPPLRPYQADTLQRMKSYEGNAALCVIATGLGKTRIFAEYIRCDVLENDHHILILSHREELVIQPLEYLKGLPCGIEQGTTHAHGEPIISASVQSLVGRLDKYNPYSIDTIIIDEAHHSAAPTYRKIFEYFKNAVRFGFTATAIRGDGVGLDVAFDDILCEYNTLYGIEHGYLSPIEACQVNLKYDLGTVQYREDTGDYDAADIARVMSGTAAGIAEAYTSNARGQTIIFAPSIEEGKNVTALLNSQHGASTAAFIDGTTQNRGRLLEAYRLGLIKVLVCYAVLTEGVDLPMTETVLLARPVATTNVGLYAQMVGRGLRLHPGKSACKIIDCVGISRMPICTAATLIGEEPLAPKPKKEQVEKLPEETEPIKVLTGADIPDTWIQNQKEVDIMALGEGVTTHDVAWITLKDGGYILPIPTVTYRISKPLTNGMVYLRKNKACSKSAVPLQFALDYVYQDLKQKHAKYQHIWDKKQRYKWDRQPITNEQIALIHKLAPDYKIDTHKMTRGDASRAIQLLTYKPEEWTPQTTPSEVQDDAKKSP